MERVQEQEQTPEVFENDIEAYLKMFCEEQNIKDMKKEPQSVWNGALMYIKRHVFNVPGILKMSKPLEGYINNNKGINKSNCNSYDIELVNGVCDYYIYLCNLYDKEISIIGFSNLTGIDTDSINNWGNETNALSTAGLVVYKKLHQGREESLSNKLVTGKQNPVGVLGVLNRHYGWNAPGIRNDNNKIPARSAAELPQLDTTKDETQYIDVKDGQTQDVVPD